MKSPIPILTFHSDRPVLIVIKLFQITNQWNSQNKCYHQKTWNKQIWKLYFHEFNFKERIIKIKRTKHFRNETKNNKIKKNCHESAFCFFKNIKSNFIKKITIHKSLLLSAVGLGTQKARTFCVPFNVNSISQNKIVNKL